MFLSAVSVLVVARSSSGIPEGLMNNPVNRIVSPQKFSVGMEVRYWNNLGLRMKKSSSAIRLEKYRLSGSNVCLLAGYAVFPLLLPPHSLYANSVYFQYSS